MVPRIWYPGTGCQPGRVPWYPLRGELPAHAVLIRVELGERGVAAFTTIVGGNNEDMHFFEGGGMYCKITMSGRLTVVVPRQSSPSVTN